MKRKLRFIFYDSRWWTFRFRFNFVTLISAHHRWRNASTCCVIKRWKLSASKCLSAQNGLCNGIINQFAVSRRCVGVVGVYYHRISLRHRRQKSQKRIEAHFVFNVNRQFILCKYGYSQQHPPNSHDIVPTPTFKPPRVRIELNVWK